jgi:hypothetical protein
MKLLLNYYLLLLLVFGCAHTPRPTVPVPESPRVETPAPAPEAPVAREVFTTKSKLEWIKSLVLAANCVINSEAFLAEVAAHPKFDFTDKTSPEVVQVIRSLAPVNVATYYTKWRWSKTIATTWVNEPETLYLNLYKNPRPMPEMVNTLIHEGLHPEFGHGSNWAGGKDNSVNYKAGEIAEKHTEKCL